ncbi:MAG: hypothetical protein IPK16_24295 [Anaerolineales bacterium]|nr:hypothetical protein [Anaerolineales bacterium]
MDRRRCMHVIIAWVGILSLIAITGLGSAGPLLAAQDDDQVSPDAGQWKTWVLTAGDEMRPPAPPNQAGAKQELMALQALVAQRDAEESSKSRIGMPAHPVIAGHSLRLHNLARSR